MEKQQLLLLKSGLLCRGVRVDNSARKSLMREYPQFFDKGFIDAANMSVCGMNVCVSAGEKFTFSSPYLLEHDDGGYYIEYCGERVPVTFFGALPQTGTFLDSMARLHSEGCINIWPSSVCCFDTERGKCAFCSLERTSARPVEPEKMASALKILLSKCSGALNFSGGTYISPDDMARYWIDLTARIREFSSCPIAVELAPPQDLSLLTKLHEAGATACIMNLEVASEELRRVICPGKSAIAKAHYYAAFKRAVADFGYGMVSSVLIAGVQPASDIVAECRALAKMGVYPTIMPLRPMDSCALRDTPPCDPAELLAMSEELGAILRERGMDPNCQPGCTKCGGCSLENDCRKFGAFRGVS